MKIFPYDAKLIPNEHQYLSKSSHGSNLEQKTKWGQVYKETGIIL